ncbi:MOD1, partial [Symbiodinium sp. KB8]
VASGSFAGAAPRLPPRGRVARKAMTVDLTGKVAFIAGVADTTGYGWAIARELANAGATIIVGTWPPVLKMFNMALKKKATQEAMKLDDGSLMEIAKIYPLDAMFDIPDDVPEDIKSNKRYAGVEGYTIEEVAEAVKKDYGKIDILVHSLANGPEVTKPLLETSRKGYLAASSASAYSLVSMVQRFGPIMPEGSSVLSLSYVAAVRTIPGYGGGMSSAKAQLESDTRTLAYEAGRKYGIRINTISAGPLKSRAASAIGGDGEKTFIERAIDYSATWMHNFGFAPRSSQSALESADSALLQVQSDTVLAPQSSGWVQMDPICCSLTDESSKDIPPEASRSISFGIAPEKWSNTSSFRRDSAKTTMFSPLIPGHKETYIYDTEYAYYMQYSQALFGITMKKGGWDCFRHYEIIMSGSIPFFIGLEDMPKRTMTSFPKKLVASAMALPGVPSAAEVVKSMAMGK